MTTDDEALMTASEIARLAGVGRAAVGNWRKRHVDFPTPAGGTEASPAFRRVEVELWLRANDKIDDQVDADRLWQRVDAFRWSGRTAAVLAALGLVLMRGSEEPGLRTWAAQAHPELASALDGGVEDDARALAADALAVAGKDGGPALFEDLCRRLVDERSGQVHATPPELADLMVALAGPSSCRDVLDPACGSGGLLLAAARAGVPRLLGQELEPAIAMLARVRLALAGIEATVEVEDTLRVDAFPGETVDAVVAHPPFGLRDWQNDNTFADPRWSLGLPPKGEADLAWVLHCLAQIEMGGDVVVVLPAGAAFRSAGRRIRAELIRRDLVRAMIALPPGTFPDTGIAPLLWLLHEKDPQEQEEGAEGVIMIDASHHVRDRRIDWSGVRRTVEDSLATPEAAAPDIARRVSAIELLDDEVSLVPTRHLRAAPPAAEDIASIRDRLLTLLDRARASVPVVRESPSSPSPRWSPLKELASTGALALLSAPTRMEVADDGDGPIVLTARDIAAGRAASGHLVEAGVERVVELEPGDVVVPLIAQRPIARIVEEAGSILGANTLAIRPRPDVIDSWYLAGVLQGEHVVRSSSTVSGAFRFSPRNVEIPVIPLGEQSQFAETFRRLAELEGALARVSELGAELATTVRSGLVDGSLEPGVGPSPRTRDGGEARLASTRQQARRT